MSRPPRIGLVGRPETHRGLGIQTQEFAKHMPVAKVLQVNFPTITGPRNPGAFSAPLEVAYDPIRHGLPMLAMREFLSGLDVVFTAETPYDWSMLDLARDMGVKTIIQGNPEFFRHGQPGYDYPHPDAWWWPTSWRLDRLPYGPVVPVPMPDTEVLASQPEGRLRILHVVGKRAWQDRNGTDLFYQALGNVREEVDVTIIGVDGELAAMMPRRNLRIKLLPDGVPDRWSMYRNHHLLVMPRKYGGLCLPTLEAMAAGLAVMMPEISPNTGWPIIPMPLQHLLSVNMACGEVSAAYTDPYAMANLIDGFAVDVGKVKPWSDEGREKTLWWTRGGTDLYLQKMEAML